MNIAEWENEVEKLTEVERVELAKALAVLLDWETFKKEYDWTGLKVIRQILITSLK